MAKSSTCVVLLLATCLLSTQVVSGRQLLDTSDKPAIEPTVKAILTDVLCAVDTIDAVVEQFLGLKENDLGGLPTAIAAVLNLDSEIETKLEKLLGIVPPASCSKVPKAPTLANIVEILYCDIGKVEAGLKEAVAECLPLSTNDPLAVAVSELYDATQEVEADLLKFATGITCS